MPIITVRLCNMSIYGIGQKEWINRWNTARDIEFFIRWRSRKPIKNWGNWTKALRRPLFVKTLTSTYHIYNIGQSDASNRASYRPTLLSRPELPWNIASCNVTRVMPSRSIRYYAWKQRPYDNVGSLRGLSAVVFQFCAVGKLARKYWIRKFVLNCQAIIGPYYFHIGLTVGLQCIYVWMRESLAAGHA